MPSMLHLPSIPRVAGRAALFAASFLPAFFLPAGTSAVRSAGAAEPEAAPRLEAGRAFGYLTRICNIGPRVSGTTGMTRQQRMIQQHMSDLGGKVGYQSFDAPHPLTGRPVRLDNMVVTWNPEAKQRVLLACHYDTRPFPDQDPRNPRGRFIGANDGASGVALFMELAHHMRKIDLPYGVDFVFFDAEELIYVENDGSTRGEYFLGSTYFANEYKNNPPPHKYVCGVLVDMIADKRLELYMEKYSLKYAPEVTRSLWKTAERMSVEEFIPREKHEVRDDHIPLNEIADIPTCDIIDFDYPDWHTTQDVPARCSGESLVKVGRVLLEWLQHDVPAPRSDE
ncbi:MAG: M28 family peptidase [Planctomycetaceae bacterium]